MPPPGTPGTPVRTPRVARSAFAGIIDFVETRGAAARAALVAAAQDVDRELARYLAQYDQTAGRLTATKANLALLDRSSKRLNELVLGSGYESSIRKTLAEIPELAARVEDAYAAVGVPRSFARPDIAAFRQIINARFDAFANIGEAGAEALRLLLERAVAGGTSADALGDAFREVLFAGGRVDRAGGGMFRHAATLVDTSLSELGRLMTRKLGDDAGVTKWIYYGGLIETSRPFCRERDGRMFTLAEIEQMDNEQTGPGTVFATMGGYNCRHVWLPVVDEDAVTLPPADVAARDEQAKKRAAGARIRKRVRKAPGPQPAPAPGPPVPLAEAYADFEAFAEAYGLTRAPGETGRHVAQAANWWKKNVLGKGQLREPLPVGARMSLAARVQSGFGGRLPSRKAAERLYREAAATYDDAAILAAFRPGFIRPGAASAEVRKRSLELVERQRSLRARILLAEEFDVDLGFNGKFLSIKRTIAAGRKELADLGIDGAALEKQATKQGAELVAAAERLVAERDEALNLAFEQVKASPAVRAVEARIEALRAEGRALMDAGRRVPNALDVQFELLVDEREAIINADAALSAARAARTAAVQALGQTRAEAFEATRRVYGEAREKVVEGLLALNGSEAARGSARTILDRAIASGGEQPIPRPGLGRVAGKGTIPEQIEQAAEFLGATHRSIMAHPQFSALRIYGRKDQRAYAEKIQNYIALDTHRGSKGWQIVVHEFGHHVEFNDPAIAARAQAWLRSRRDPSGKTRPFLGRTDEPIYVGTYWDEYVGKVYDDTTSEVISMAMEALTDEAKFENMVRKNPEVLDLIFAILRGK